MRRSFTALLLSLALAGCASGRFGPSSDIEAPAGPHTLKKLSVDERRQAMERARVWQAIDTNSLDLIKGPDLPPALRIGAETTCTFVHPAKPLSGNTPKFQCAVQKGDDVKVKYGEKNGEVYAEVAASRLLWALGFKADVMLPTRVTCLDCPVADPFMVSAMEWTRTGPRERTKRVFDPAIVEREITGKSIEVPGYEGWAWPELDQIRPREGAATRAHIDALKLLAVFIQHSDTKPDQQELVCAEGRNRKDAKGNETCETAWLVIKDLGATFGKATRFNSSKMNLADWDSAKVWKPGATCVGDLPRSLTGSLDNPVIGEAGRRFLARRLSQLRDKQIRDLFVASQIQRRGEEITDASGRKRKVTVDDWVRVFKRKRAEITAARCSG
jgi:hypothetical protein